MLGIIYKLRKSSIGKKIKSNNSVVVQWIKKVIRFFVKNEWKECRKSYGEENPDIIFYVIRRDAAVVGLFSYVFSVLSHIKYALKNGWIPVVDMKNYLNAYLYDDEIGKINSWEYYFIQPCGYSLEEVYRSKNVILSDGNIRDDRPRPTKALLENENGLLDEWREVVSNYLIMNETTKNCVDKEWKKLFLEKERVLGIICRGTDYTYLKPKGHPIQPEVLDIVKKANTVIEKFNLNKVFIATEDIKIYEEIKSGLSIEAVTNSKKWVDYQGDYLAVYTNKLGRSNDKYLSGLEYLTTIGILSRCNCLIGGRPGGATAAMLLSKGYEYTYFWYLGDY